MFRKKGRTATVEELSNEHFTLRKVSKYFCNTVYDAHAELYLSPALIHSVGEPFVSDWGMSLVRVRFRRPTSQARSIHSQPTGVQLPLKWAALLKYK